MLLFRKKHEPQPGGDPAFAASIEAAGAAQRAAQGAASEDDAASSAQAPQAALIAPDLEAVSQGPATPVPGEREDHHLLIPSGVRFRGEIAGCDRVVIDGAVEGEIKSCRHIALSASGSFNGVADTTDAYIAGAWTGSLTVRDKLSVGPTARLSGLVRYARLVVDDGGVVDADLRRIADEAAETSTILRAVSRLSETETKLKTQVEPYPQPSALVGLRQLARQAAPMAADPEDLAIRAELARALRQQGEFARARQIVEKFPDADAAGANG